MRPYNHVEKVKYFGAGLMVGIAIFWLPFLVSLVIGLVAAIVCLHLIFNIRVSRLFVGAVQYVQWQKKLLVSQRKLKSFQNFYNYEWRLGSSVPGQLNKSFCNASLSGYDATRLLIRSKPRDEMWLRNAESLIKLTAEIQKLSESVRPLFQSEEIVSKSSEQIRQFGLRMEAWEANLKAIYNRAMAPYQAQAEAALIQPEDEFEQLMQAS